LDQPQSEQSLLSVQSVSKAINNNPVVNEVSFLQQESQKIAIAGETGSGKSTLLKMIGGLVQPDAGKIYFRQKRVMGPDYQLVPGESGIAYLSQHYELRNHYRMEELLSYASTMTEQESEDIYEVCRIRHLLNRNTFQLSGGEKQRIALARLLVGAPRLLLLDEPFSNLDLIHKSILKSVIEDISGKLGITCILASHDPSDTLSWADRMIVLQGGSIVQEGLPVHIYRNPESEYVAGLFGTYTILEPELATAFSLTAEGNAAALFRPEFFTISVHMHPGSLPATVRNISFHGAYDELLVNVNGYEVMVTLLNNTFHTGDKIYISPDRDKVVYITR